MYNFSVRTCSGDDVVRRIEGFLSVFLCKAVGHRQICKPSDHPYTAFFLTYKQLWMISMTLLLCLFHTCTHTLKAHSSYAIHQTSNPPDAPSPQCVCVVRCAALPQLTSSKTSGHLFMSQPVTHTLTCCHQPATINRFQLVSHCQYSSAVQSDQRASF